MSRKRKPPVIENISKVASRRQVEEFNANAVYCKHFKYVDIEEVDQFGLKTKYKSAFCTLLNFKCHIKRCPLINCDH